MPAAKVGWVESDKTGSFAQPKAVYWGGRPMLLVPPLMAMPFLEPVGPPPKRLGRIVIPPPLPPPPLRRQPPPPPLLPARFRRKQPPPLPPLPPRRQPSEPLMMEEVSGQRRMGQIGAVDPTLMTPSPMLRISLGARPLGPPPPTPMAKPPTGRNFEEGPGQGQAEAEAQQASLLNLLQLRLASRRPAIAGDEDEDDDAAAGGQASRKSRKCIAAADAVS